MGLFARQLGMQEKRKTLAKLEDLGGPLSEAQFKSLLKVNVMKDK